MRTIVRRELSFNREQIELIKTTVAKGTTDEQLNLFLYTCKKHRLDPLVGQIYCVLWPRDNGKYHDMVIITGINGFRATAARDHKDYAGTSRPKFEMGTRKTPANRPIPESCVMQAFRKTQAGIQLAAETEIFWDEYAPSDLSTKKADFWRRMPRNQLAKCCEAQVLRKAFADLSNVFVEEEVAQRMQDFTPGGREISIDGVNPSGQIASGAQHGSRQAAQTVLADKLAGKTQEGVPGAAWKREQELRADRPPIDVKASHGQPESQRPKRHATLDWTNPKSPILTGDIADLVPRAKPPYGLLKGLNITWQADELWHVDPSAVNDLRTVCAEAGYELKELRGNAATAPKSSGDKGKPEAKPSTGAGAKPGAKQESASPMTVSGTIERTNMGMAGKSPVKYVTLVKVDKTKPTLGCFHKSMWDEIEKGLGKLAVFGVVTKGNYTNIEKLIKIGSKEWDDQGMPAIQNSTREAGMKTLF